MHLPGHHPPCLATHMMGPYRINMTLQQITLGLFITFAELLSVVLWPDHNGIILINTHLQTLAKDG